MKIFSFIFSFYILFLTVEPSLRNMGAISSQETGTCCGSFCVPIEKNQSENQADNKEDTENKACNPFQSCKCCIGFNPNFVFLTFTPIPLLGQSQTVSNEKIPLQISLDFWQPPKVGKRPNWKCIMFSDVYFHPSQIKYGLNWFH